MRTGYAHMRMILLLVVVVMMSTFPLALDVAGAAPNPIPITTVNLDVDMLELKAYPYSASIAIINGNVSVEKCQGLERVIVELTYDLDVGWPVWIKPRTIPFINPGDQPFQVFVIIPPDHEPFNGKLTVKGVARAPGHGPQMGKDDCSIKLSPIYLSMLEVNGSQCVKGEDGEARFPVRVWNLGTAEDTYLLDLVSSGTPIENWDGSVEIVLAPRSFVETNITVHYEEARYPSQIWSAELTIRSSLTHDQDVPSNYYVGDPSSTELWVYDEGPAMGPILGIDMSAGMTVMIFQFAILVSVLVIYSRRSR